MMIGDALVSARSGRCLGERTLVRLAEEGGTPRQRRHLEGCTYCAERHSAIIRARDAAAVVLRDAALRYSPLPIAIGSGRTPRTAGNTGRAHDVVRWAAPIAMAAGLVLAFVVESHRAVDIGGQHVATGAIESNAPLSLDDLSRSAFMIDDASVWLEADADETRWEAALLGERPCETESGVTDPQCD
jgi:hypothetical protein